MTATYLGIDLGTSNSAVSIFQNGNARALLNPYGEVNTPSVVRYTKKGVIVGDKAKRHIFSDSRNTFKEFKRLLGTESTLNCSPIKEKLSPELLSSEILKYLKLQAENQTKHSFSKVVITVPALFEIPQSRATAEAARLAGFEQVELLPEPVASGLAAGWNESESGKAWMVYDLGGGTFDVSLLESRDGLLRVIGHDGDNFLGGRDIDRAVVAWLCQHLEEHHGFKLDENHDDFAQVRRQMESSVEKAKVILSSTSQTQIELEFEFDDEEYEFDIPIKQEQLHEISLPLIQRSIDICKRLLGHHGLQISDLSRVVLVGGPAHMPLIQNMVSEQLAPIAESEHDPMSLVSLGAAIYSATLGLAGQASSHGNDTQESKQQKLDIWLQYPSVCTELNPLIMGRVVNESLGICAVKIENVASRWQSDFVEVGSDGLFSMELNITAGSKNVFKILAFNASKKIVEHQSAELSIVHGLTMSDPPLSRTIGIALADGTVKSFIERGTPLPAKRTFTQNTVDTLMPNTSDCLNIPIVQGERRQARFCRQVGNLTIKSQDLNRPLQVGTQIDITIEVDRGGDLRAQAHIKEHNILVNGIAQLLMSTASVDAMRSSATHVHARLSSRLQQAFRDRDEATITCLTPVSKRMESVLAEVMALKEGNHDAQLRLSRNLMELEAELEQIESKDGLKDLLEECEEKYFSASDLVKAHGDEAQHRILESCAKHMQLCMSQPRQAEIERLIERLVQLQNAAHRNSEDFWVDVFEYWSSFVAEASDPRRARKLVDKGNDAQKNNNKAALKKITHELFDLIPAKFKAQGGPGGHDSGVY